MLGQRLRLGCDVKKREWNDKYLFCYSWTLNLRQNYIVMLKKGMMNDYIFLGFFIFNKITLIGILERTSKSLIASLGRV